MGGRAVAWLVSSRRKVVDDQANLDAASRVVRAQGLPSMNQWLPEAISASKQRLNSESSRELGRLKLMADHQSIKTEY
ncbi:hypothetical protein D3C86_647540 [compost metagenome]